MVWLHTGDWWPEAKVLLVTLKLIDSQQLPSLQHWYFVSDRTGGSVFHAAFRKSILVLRLILENNFALITKDMTWKKPE